MQPSDRKPSASELEAYAANDAQIQANQGKTWTFKINSYADFDQPCPKYQQPKEFACFSNDERRQYVYGDQELRYYYPADLMSNLGEGFETRYIERDSGILDHLDGLLTTLVRVKQNEPNKAPLTKANVICYRGVLSRIMCSPYERRDDWILGATLYKGMLHIEERESMSKYDFRLNATRRHRLACYYGYKFETLSTVSKPASQISPDDPELKQRRRATVNTNVQYCSVFTTKLNDISLVMGAEVDCCIEKNPENPSAGYVELKTSRWIRNERERENFAHQKLFKYWVQSFLAAVPKIIVGYRDDQGRLRSIQEINTLRIPRMVREQPRIWQPNICLNFGYQLLKWLRTIITIDDPYVVYTISFSAPWQEVEVTCLGRNTSFLTKEYIQDLERESARA